METLTFIWENVIIKTLDKLSWLVTLILIVLKLTGVLEITWMWTLFPIWIYILVTSPIWIALIIYKNKKHEKDNLNKWS